MFHERNKQIDIKFYFFKRLSKKMNYQVVAAYREVADIIIKLLKLE